MAGITVRIYAPLSDRLGLRSGGGPATVEIPAEEAGTLRAVFDRLAERYPKLESSLDSATGLPLGHIVVSVDGRLVDDVGQYETRLYGDVEVLLLPAYVGG